MFGVEVSEPRRVGELANGAAGYEAEVAFYREGARVGSGRWDVEGFEGCVGLDGRPLDLFPSGDEGDVYYALATEVRGYLSRLAKPERVEPDQPWRVNGEVRSLEVMSVDGDEATLRVRALGTGKWAMWGRAPVSSMLTCRSWTSIGKRS
jgi:hypothetical protein